MGVFIYRSQCTRDLMLNFPFGSQAVKAQCQKIVWSVAFGYLKNSLPSNFAQ